MSIAASVALNVTKNPTKPFYIYADADMSEIVTITHLEFGRATHRAANILRPNGQGPEGQVVAVLALVDTISFHAILAGLLTANLIDSDISTKPFPMSPRNSPAGIFNLLRASSYHRIIVTCVTLAPLLAEIREYGGQIDPDFVLNIKESPSLRQLYPNLGREQPHCSFQPYPTYVSHASLDDIALYLHSSGSTASEGHRPDSSSNHTMGQFITNCRSLQTVPALFATWFNSASAMAYLKTLHTIVWGGGPLPQRIGDALVAAGVNLLATYGTTEIGPVSSFLQYEGDAKEWAWFRFSDQIKVRWAAQGEGTFECQVLAGDSHRPMVENMSDVKGYATSDLCINHPTKKHLWKITEGYTKYRAHRRRDYSHIRGKTVPAPMEDIVMSSPRYFDRNAGESANRRPNLQIDVQNEIQLAALRNKIWPIVSDANEIAPAFSRIFKEMIIFRSRDKPLPRAGKGTVLRKVAISLFKSVEEQTNLSTSVDPPAEWEADILEEWLLNLAGRFSRVTPLSPTADLFQQGFDRDILFQERYGSRKLRLVKFPEWHQELRARETSGSYTGEALPGLKLLEFFGRLAKLSAASADTEFGGISFSVEKMLSLSPAVRGVESINKKNVEACVDYWQTAGFI
ncbi:hypothetical protein C8R43DRAFT_1101377 [Mycena crocata]|nr:hypothetical protein C8R43DRAFT_1101377 [Mycena crocata]